MYLERMLLRNFYTQISLFIFVGYYLFYIQGSSTLYGRLSGVNKLIQILFDDMLSTVWSAPNYCYRAGNLASILEIGQYLDRHFNGFFTSNVVYGPAPTVNAKKRSRIDDILASDITSQKKMELESKGVGLAYSLGIKDEHFPDSAFGQLTINEYFT
jgi:hypothetical protein